MLLSDKGILKKIIIRLFLRLTFVLSGERSCSVVLSSARSSTFVFLASRFLRSRVVAISLFFLHFSSYLLATSSSCALITLKRILTVRSSEASSSPVAPYSKMPFISFPACSSDSILNSFCLSRNSVMYLSSAMFTILS